MDEKSSRSENGKRNIKVSLLISVITVILICIIVPNAGYLLMFRNTEDFRYFWKMLVTVRKKQF